MNSDAVAMPRPPGLGAGRPHGVAGREFKLVGVGRLVFLPRRDPAREGQLAERLAQQRLRGGLCVEVRDILGLEFSQRLALHEQPFNAEDRREFVMLLRQCAHLRLNAEQLRHEVLKLRRQRYQQFGFRLARKRIGRGARRDQGIAQRGVCYRDKIEELRVQSRQAGALVKVRIFNSEGQLEHDLGAPQWGWRTIKACLLSIKLRRCIRAQR